MQQLTFATKADARAAGLITVAEARRLCHSKTPLIVQDTSGPNRFGYSFGIARRDTNEQVMESIDCWFTDEPGQMGHKGCFDPMFYELSILAVLQRVPPEAD